MNDKYQAWLYQIVLLTKLFAMTKEDRDERKLLLNKITNELNKPLCKRPNFNQRAMWNLM